MRIATHHSGVLRTVALLGIVLAAPGCGPGRAPATKAAFTPEIPELPQFPEELYVDLLWTPEDNPITPEKVALGWQLFYDTRISSDESISCASCHVPAAGFADPRPGSIGVGGAVGARNAPTVINALFNKVQFWDGRAHSLEEQAVGPIMNSIEMANTLEGLIERLSQVPGYRKQFEAVFGTDEITSDRVGQAIATFERMVVSANSPWDRYERTGDASLVSDAARRGHDLFNDKAGCSQCHSVKIDAEPEDLFQNTGVGMKKDEPDLGRFTISGEDEDRGAFKVPSLRNVAQTAPYMHDGSLATLKDVVRFYNDGGHPNQWLDKRMKPLELTDQEIDDLVAFLEALTGEVPEFTLREPPLPPDEA